MTLKKFPGFIDVHVHLREPGATQKEDFTTGTRAAITGGFTFVIDMPNNPIPTFSLEALEEKIKLADKKAVCDVGFHFGTNGKNLNDFKSAFSHPRVFGLKVYCNHTTGDFLIDDPKVLEQIFAAWESTKPIMVHAEEEKVEECINLSKKYGRRLHICHISQKEEVEMVRKAKKAKLKVTAGVTPHHLFLTASDIKTLGNFALVKPPLYPKRNQDALWKGLIDGTIDLVESDHAPHTKQEKLAEKPAFGLPNLETTLGLLFKAVHDKKITEKDIIRLLYDNPKRIFNIPEQKNTYIELDPEKSYRVGENGYQTKCGWSPFDKWRLYGKTENVILRGKKIMNRGKIL
jgi:carbamoyl-phosphate synthase/aspartate carbamoyltransferase/dihydroorotase